MVNVPGWAARSAPRRLGYRLLGDRFAYLLHLRPAEWPIMLAHTALGYVLAVGVAGVAQGRFAGNAIAGLTLWVVGLNGGTLALNSAFDRDEGDIGYLTAPPPVPRHLVTFGLGLMLIGQAGALLLPLQFAWAYAACFVLSVLYSVPPFRFKAVAGADWLINMWGFGALTPYAGWALTGLPVDPARFIVILAFAPLFAALYPLTQLYQFEEDSRRGDRTLALILGMHRSLVVATGAAGLAFAMFAWAGVRAGWGWSGSDALRWSALAVALAAWAGVLIPWLARHASMRPADHQRGMYRALGAWAVTDVVVVMVWGL